VIVQKESARLVYSEQSLRHKELSTSRGGMLTAVASLAPHGSTLRDWQAARSGTYRLSHKTHLRQALERLKAHPIALRQSSVVNADNEEWGLYGARGCTRRQSVANRTSRSSCD
jgi:hypothetical protein